MEHTEFTPDWENAKSIINWMSIDANGDIWHYENEPFLRTETWNAINCVCQFIGTTTPPTDFTKCIYQRPKTETP
jgi:hypothetical protein